MTGSGAHVSGDSPLTVNERRQLDKLRTWCKHGSRPAEIVMCQIHYRARERWPIFSKYPVGFLEVPFPCWVTPSTLTPVWFWRGLFSLIPASSRSWGTQERVTVLYLNCEGKSTNMHSQWRIKRARKKTANYGHAQEHSWARYTVSLAVEECVFQANVSWICRNTSLLSLWSHPLWWTARLALPCS